MNEYLKEIEQSNSKYEKRTKKLWTLFAIILLIITVLTIYNSSKTMVDVTISTNGTIVSKETQEHENLSDFLDKEKIVVGADDYIMLNNKYISLDDFETIELKSGDAITIQQVESKEETKQEAVKYKTQKVNTDKLFVGETKVKQKGKEGIRTITYNVKTFEGKEVDRVETKSVVTTKPVNKIVLVGTKEKEVEKPAIPEYTEEVDDSYSTTKQASTEAKAEDSQQQQVDKQKESSNACTININGEIVPCNN